MTSPTCPVFEPPGSTTTARAFVADPIPERSRRSGREPLTVDAFRQMRAIGFTTRIGRSADQHCEAGPSRIRRPGKTGGRHSADVVFIAVGTPSRRGDGHADLSYSPRDCAGAFEIHPGRDQGAGLLECRMAGRRPHARRALVGSATAKAGSRCTAWRAARSARH